MSDKDNELDGMAAIASGVHSQTWPHTMDAAVWAQKWAEAIRNHPHIPFDEGSMIGWFANAIMAGYDTATMKGNKS